MCVRTDENLEVFVLCGFCRPGANARGKTCKNSKKWRSATFSTLCGRQRIAASLYRYIAAIVALKSSSLSISQLAIFGSPKGDMRNVPIIPKAPACVCPIKSAISESRNRTLDSTDSTAAEQMQKKRHIPMMIPNANRRGNNNILKSPRIAVSPFLLVSMGAYHPQRRKSILSVSKRTICSCFQMEANRVRISLAASNIR